MSANATPLPMVHSFEARRCEVGNPDARLGRVPWSMGANIERLRRIGCNWNKNQGNQSSGFLAVTHQLFKGASLRTQRGVDNTRSKVSDERSR